MASKSLSLALFVDYENLQTALNQCESNFYKPYSYNELCNYLNCHYGNVNYSKAYADWRNASLRKKSIELQRHNVPMQNVFTTGKGVSATLIASCMVLDTLDCLKLNPEIGAFVFFSNDIALLPLFNRLNILGKKIILINVDGFVNPVLVRASDEFVCLCDKGYSQKAPDSMDKVFIHTTLKNLLANGEVPLATLEQQLLDEVPDFTPNEYGCNSLQDFIQKTAAHLMRVVEDADGGPMVCLGSGRNASAYSDDELSKFSFAEYMQATRWFIQDGNIRDRVLHNIYALFEDGNRVLSNEDLRNMVDPDRIVEDKPWHGTIFSLVYGACLWENPDTSGQHLPNRRLSLFRTVKSEDDFLVRYYVSLFHKAYTDRPGLTPRDCAELMHPDDVEAHLPLYEQVFEVLNTRK